MTVPDSVKKKRQLWEKGMCQKVPLQCLKCLSLLKAALGYFYGMSRVLSESLRLSEVVLGVLDRVGDAEGGVW